MQIQSVEFISCTYLHRLLPSIVDRLCHLHYERDHTCFQSTLELLARFRPRAWSRAHSLFRIRVSKVLDLVLAPNFGQKLK